MALKLLSSMVQLNEHKQRVYAIFIAMAFGAACLMLCVSNIRPKPDPPAPGGLVGAGGRHGVWADKVQPARVLCVLCVLCVLFVLCGRVSVCAVSV